MTSEPLPNLNENTLQVTLQQLTRKIIICPNKIALDNKKNNKQKVLKFNNPSYHKQGTSIIGGTTPRASQGGCPGSPRPGYAAVWLGCLLIQNVKTIHAADHANPMALVTVKSGSLTDKQPERGFSEMFS